MEEREIYLLITRYLQKQTNTTENEMLADWMTSSADNEQTFEEIKQAWLSVEKPNVSESANALSKLKNRIRQGTDQQIKTKKLFPLKWSRIAASLVLIGSLSFAIIFLAQSPKKSITVMNSLATKVGEMKTITLSDGTKISLGSKSILRYPVKFEENERSIQLDGEAYFEVSKNPHKPFVVNTNDLSVKVLGTHFNVNASKNQVFTTVSLLEGKVEVNLNDDQDGAYTLKPGEELSVNRNNLQVFQRKLDSVSVLGWMTKTLVFSNDKLSDAAVKIENMYGVKLVFADQATADTRLYAQFNNDKLDDVLEIICSTGNLIYSKNGNKIYLSAK